MAMFIDWSSIKDMRSLVELLNDFLTKVFGKELLHKETMKLDLYVPKGKPESLEYLRPVGVHRAAKWHKLLRKLKEHDYSFDLRFSTEIEEFMNLMLFTYSFNLLIQHKVLSLDNSIVRGRLTDKNGFESLLYEVLVASNYTSNKFKVCLLDLLGTGRTDIYARKGGVEVYCECKRLRRKERYVDLAIKLMSEFHREKQSLIVDVELRKKPKSIEDIENLVKLVKRAVEEGKPIEGTEAVIKVQSLPELIQDVYEISVSKPETIEYLVSAAYVGIFNGVFKVREPKILVIRNPNKAEELEKQLINELRKAVKQLNSVGNDRRVIYVDISEVAGRPIIQLPEMIKLSMGPELLTSHLGNICRKWLEAHPDIDAIVLTTPKLYTDEFGNPYLINVENQVIAAHIAPGWAIETMILPIPRGASSGILVNLGVEATKKGNYRLAFFYYRKAIEMNPDQKEAYNNLGRLLTDLGRPDEALKYLNKALELDPNYVFALINRGIALTRLGRYAKAINDLDKALSLNPDNEKIWYNRALIYYIIGQCDEAHKSVLKALDINPNYEAAKKLKELIEKPRRENNQ
ncbi:MAG: hypothetical protein DRJ41_03815 [Thermoprotei archaeon]|nr:MAG: hypothetical protein DRJ41_03815 [Thermoprotei archaeon]